MTWTFRAGVVRTRNPDLALEELDLIPVEAVRMIFEDGEAPFARAGAQVREMEARGKFVIPTLKARDWRRGSVADWAKVVAQFVAAVPSEVVEVGNEPWPAQQGAYWPKLKAAAPIVRGAGRKVILAPQPPAWADSFLTQAHQHDAFDLVDGIGLHPYVGQPAIQLRFVSGRRVKLDAWGAIQPLWLTEFGWGSEGTAKLGAEAMLTDEAGQAQRLLSAFQNFRDNAERHRIRAACWFSFKDWAPWLANWDHHAGVLTRDGRLKPSWNNLTVVGDWA